MTATLLRPPPALQPGTRPGDQRRWKRVPIRLTGRFMTPGGHEEAFFTTEVSCDGAVVMTGVPAGPGTQVVCYFDELGRVSGTVARTVPGGFAVVFNAPVHKRDKLADRLTWLLNRDRLNLEEERGSDRHRPGGDALVCCADGRELTCSVTDMSLTGAAFETRQQPPFVGEHVRIGNLRAEVVRVTDRTFAVRYLTLRRTEQAGS